ncbi:MAG: hypothetical protein AB2A00_15205 [Myxococcota bacterium]
MRNRMRMGGVVLCLGLLGCDLLPGFFGNQLSGSIASAEDLQFDEVDARKFPSGEIQIRYKRNRNGNNEIVAQVSVLPPAEGIRYGQDIDLPSNRGAVNRVVQSAADFPPLKSGSIRFDSGAVNSGDATRGRFNATFENDKTLNGTFDAQLEVVGF